MTHDEQIDMIRREIADLRERVKVLEEAPSRHVHGTSTAPYFSLPATMLPAAAPPQPPIYSGGWLCSCPVGTVCSVAGCPRANQALIAGAPNR